MAILEGKPEFKGRRKGMTFRTEYKTERRGKNGNLERPARSPWKLLSSYKKNVLTRTIYRGEKNMKSLAVRESA